MVARKRGDEGSPKSAKKPKPADESGSEFGVDEEETKHMAAVMGITTFSSSKGKDHSATSVSGVMRVSKRKQRQVLGRPKQAAKRMRM
jgi:hypothetical protein